MNLKDHSFELAIFAILVVARYFGLDTELFAIGSALLGLGIGYHLGGGDASPKT